ncbi:MAG: HD domain-containing protein [Nanoarchaeota archaeon]|nr:HD domain-containing protein [Nanoarchaeota archaeon]MBU1269110.1 HD domain-containing protein [Nanoarchaeota archaeon]MBU1604907.1 HD domain-containing protein [Nanoarchaeota archaeon]MBU2443116.1 HD domain-containing protein [Nanoarchaeota archaeon]
MNNVDNNPNYKRIYGEVCKLFLKTKHFKHGPFDETFYTLRVFESAKEIMKRLKVPCKKEQVLVATILHDVGKTKLDDKKVFGKDSFLKGHEKEWFKHASLGVPIARNILKKMGHSEDFIKEVSYLIKNHDMRGKRGTKLKDKTLELQIIQDADLIADCGSAGFIRPFLFSGKFNNHTIISQIKYVQEVKHRVGMDAMINLEVSKKIAEEKMKLQKRLVSEISKDIKSELL